MVAEGAKEGGQRGPLFVFATNQTFIYTINGISSCTAHVHSHPVQVLTFFGSPLRPFFETSVGVNCKREWEALSAAVYRE